MPTRREQSSLRNEPLLEVGELSGTFSRQSRRYWELPRLNNDNLLITQGDSERTFDRLRVAGDRSLSVRLCTWPRFPHKSRQFYGILRRVLHPDHFALISRVHDVIQQSDGQYRLDIWVDNRSNEADQVVATLIAQLPHRWHTRAHVPYHQRNSRRTGRTVLGRPFSQPLGFAAASWNIRSFQLKKQSLLLLARTNNLDILAVQETLCRADSWAPKLAGYTVYSVPSGERGAVGLALAVKTGIPSSLLEKTENWIMTEVRMANCNWIVANIYFPSGGLNHAVIREFERCLNRYTTNIARSRILVLGDFNREPDVVDQLCWRWPAPLARLPSRSSPGTFHGFRPGLVSTIDHILLGPSPLVPPKISVLRGWSDSDHWPIVVRIPAELGELPRPVPKKVCSRTFSEASKLKFLTDERWEVLTTDIDSNSPSVDAATNALLETFELVGTDVGVIRELNGPAEKRRCMSHQCRSALRNRSEKLRDFLDMGSAESRAAYVDARSRAVTALREDSRRSWAEHVEELRHTVGLRQSRQAWRWMNKFLKPQGPYHGNSLSAIFDESGVLQTSEEGKAAAWLSYYRKLFDDLTGHSGDSVWWDQFRPEQGSETTSFDPLADTWEPNELLRFLDMLANGKAPGIDKIPPEWYKAMRLQPNHEGYEAPEGFPNHAVQAFASVLSKIVESGEIPDSWQRAEIVSIPKTGDLRKPENYRGIALIPVGLKILCALVIARFNKILTANSILCQEQAGFRSREECVAQAASLMEILTRRRTTGETTYMAFIDFKKAYDMVPHEALFAKLEWAGFNGKFMEFLRGLYRTSTMTPRGTSGSVPVARGLRQGCPMSPSLFNFFINDIFAPIDGFSPQGVVVPCEDGLLHCPGLLFADDVVLFAESAEDLKRSLDHLERWANRWEMECGVRKCAVMLVPLTQEIDPIAQLQAEGPWRLHGQDVPLTRQYRYLGIEITDDLALNAHIASTRAKGIGAFGRCHRFLTSKSIPLGIRAMAYKTMVLPILAWGSELLPLDRTKYAQLSQVQSRQLRCISGLRPTSTLGCPIAIGRELNIPPFWVRAATARVRLFQKAPRLKTWLRILDERRCRLPQRGTRPWITLSDRWLRGRLNTYEGPPQLPLHEWVRREEWTRAIERSSTVSSIQYERNAFFNGRRYLEFGNYNLLSQSGLVSLFRMRTGSFLTAQRLAFMGFISPEFRSRCPFCLLPGGETIDHLLLGCPRWEPHRRTTFTAILDIVRGFNDQASASVMLLGGETRGEHIEDHILTDGDPITLSTIAFLEAITSQRLRTLQSLRLAWPPRVNAQRGTTDLQHGSELTRPDGSDPQGVLVGRNPTYPELGSSP